MECRVLSIKAIGAGNVDSLYKLNLAISTSLAKSTLLASHNNLEFSVIKEAALKPWENTSNAASLKLVFSELERYRS